MELGRSRRTMLMMMSGSPGRGGGRAQRGPELTINRHIPRHRHGPARAV